jgi:hypothetical protein
MKPDDGGTPGKKPVAPLYEQHQIGIPGLDGRVEGLDGVADH